MCSCNKWWFEIFTSHSRAQHNVDLTPTWYLQSKVISSYQLIDPKCLNNSGRWSFIQSAFNNIERPLVCYIFCNMTLAQYIPFIRQKLPQIDCNCFNFCTPDFHPTLKCMCYMCSWLISKTCRCADRRSAADPFASWVSWICHPWWHPHWHQWSKLARSISTRGSHGTITT